MKKLIFKLLLGLFVVTLVFVAGYALSFLTSFEKPIEKVVDNSGNKFACPMLCTILPEPGECPVCGMDMTVISDEPVVRMSGRAMKLASLKESTVQRKEAVSQVQVVGKIAYDESRMASITADFSGRIDKLYVDYIGMQVSKGDHIAELFSPEIVVLQQEYTLAVNSFNKASMSNSQSLKDLAEQQLKAVKTKLKAWRLTTNQIKALEKSEPLDENITINAPIGGSVMKRQVLEGDYFKEGQQLFMIADTNKLWLLLEAYETDLKWLRYGQYVEFKVEAFPEESFRGELIYIYPDMNEKSRTVKVRVNVDNSDGRLRPGMFAQGVVQVKIGEKGEVLARSFDGKWLCQMHPEVLKEEQGNCTICGMKLVATEKLPFVSTGVKENNNPLLIPISAALVTGKRAVVYRQKSMGEYEGVEVQLGPRVGDNYVLLSGLKEGEVIVTNGAFKLDSEMQIRGKNNMMSYAGEPRVKQKPIENDTPTTPVTQTLCPVMGLKVNRKLFADVNGKRIYVCCRPCIEKVKAEPNKFIQKMEQDNITIEKVP